MLTNKDVIKALNDVGYTLQEISYWTKISLNNLKKMKKNEDVDKQIEKQINNFFSLNMEEVEIANFSDQEYQKTHLIMTPNGFKKCSKYKDKGLQHSFKIEFNSFITIATNEQQFQLNNDVWVTGEELKVGDKLKVFDGESEIIDISNNGDVECCNITIDDSYYIDGIVTK